MDDAQKISTARAQARKLWRLTQDSADPSWRRAFWRRLKQAGRLERDLNRRERH